MSEQPRSPIDRLNELLVDEATIGLDERQQEELRQLLAELGLEQEDSIALTAAAVDLAVSREELEALPDHLRNKLVDSANQTLRETLSPDTPPPRSRSGEPERGDLTPRAGADRAQSPGATGWRRRDLFGALAIAASLALAAFAWWYQTPSPEPPPVTEQYRRLLESPPPDLVRVQWEPTEDPAAEGAAGEVVWSDLLQTGFMIFEGLPANDPESEQYQLWIFDRQRDERYPVDGGVFDIPDPGERVVVPINPKLPVRDATMFAITVEPPGGVVVSSRERLPLIASVPEQ